MKRRIWIAIRRRCCCCSAESRFTRCCTGASAKVPREKVRSQRCRRMRIRWSTSMLRSCVKRPSLRDFAIGRRLRSKSMRTTRSFCATPVSTTSAISIASPSPTIKRGQDTTFLAVADGRFDRKKINTYTSQFGTHESRGGREIFTVPVSGSTRKISFAFPHQNRIALTDNADLSALLAQPVKGEDAKRMARAVRSAGRFAAVRRDSPGRRDRSARWRSALPEACSRRNSPRCSNNCNGSPLRESRKATAFAW